jgi:aryl-alcohol dehydrogenase-like predicted oxidoreductase
MKYRRLGKTQIRVSVIGIGTWQLGGEWGKAFEQAEVNAMLAKATEYRRNRTTEKRGCRRRADGSMGSGLVPATCVIPGCKTVKQVESNAMAADLPMVSDDHPQVVS